MNTTKQTKLGFWKDCKSTLSIRNKWGERTTLHQAYTVSFIAFIFALIPLEFTMYNLVRFLACGSLYFFYDATKDKSEQYPNWSRVFIALMILYNPLIPIHLGDAGLWFFINIGTLLIMYKARMLFDVKELEVIPVEIGTEKE